MYNKNNLMRNVLITAKEVIFHAPTKHTLDPRMVETSIIVAEERFIKPLLGYELYTAICDAKNLTITTEEQATDYNAKLGAGETVAVGDIVNSFKFLTEPYQKLWKQQLWKLVAEAVVTSAYPEGFVQLGSEGALHNNPPAGLMVTSGFVTPLISSMKWAVDKKVQDRIAPLADSLHEYICINKLDFTLYGKLKQCPCDTNDTTKHIGIALGIYDDDEDDCGCDSEPGWMLKN